MILVAILVPCSAQLYSSSLTQPITNQLLPVLEKRES
jgi:hypothetical protein